MEIKVFSLEEAKSVLPEIKQSFREIFELNGIVKSLSSDIKLLFDIWGDGLSEAKNPDNMLYKEKVKKRNHYAKKLKRNVDNIQEIGCVVKDIENGLVDFFFDNNGDTVFLCWKYGEDDINHWHELDEGFAGRKHINELLAAVSSE